MKTAYLRIIALIVVALTINFSASAQIGVGDDTTLDAMGDTFSVVAWDTVNDEVSSAGTSCVGITIDFLGDLIFDGSNNIIGAINSQAAYNATMQGVARTRMEAGDTPAQIITFLQNNDNQSGGQAARQYGVVGSDGTGGFATAGHSGANNGSYANHLGGNINGIYYSIQGNILLNPDVLTDMESAFRNAEGTLTDRMMACLNGAKRVGGDSRCEIRGNSGRASFIKARRQGEATNYMDLTLGPVADSFEPIDALTCLYYDEVAPPVCYSTVDTFPYTMDFEDFVWHKDDVSCGSNNTTSSWIRTQFAAPTANTGPSAANEGLMYMFVEGNQGTNDRATISSPCFEIPAGSDLDLQFDYHMFGASMGQLDLDISVNGGGYTNLWTRSGNQGDTWFTENLDLSTYAGQTIKLRFDATTGGGTTSDMALDNIRIFVPVPVTCSTPIDSFNYTNGLEVTIGDWIQATGDSGNWIIDVDQGTPSGNTGPDAPSEGSDFWYIEASSNGTTGEIGANATAILESPCIDLTNTNGVHFSWDYHTFGDNIGSISLQASVIEGTWINIFTTPNTSANTWISRSEDLGAYEGGNVKLRIIGLTGTNFSSDLAIDNFQLTIPCNSTTTWNGSSWNNGVPDANVSAIINGDYDTDTDGDIEACSITINAGNALTVNAGGSLTSANNIETETNGTLTIEHQGSVLQYDRDALVVNNGNINTEVTTPSVEGRDFIIMGSSMTAETREGVFGSAFRVRQHLTAQFEPHPDVTLQFGDAINFADINTNTTVNGTNHTGLLNPGEGYVIRPQVNGAPAATFDYTHTLGTLNNGDITFNMIMGFDGTQNGSPNVMANPYASAISADAFMAANNLETLYFWEHNTQPSPAFPGQYAANFTMDDISMINSAGVGNPAATGGTAPTDVLSSMQGFAVKADAARPVTFTNNMRRISANNTLRNADLAQRDIVRLNVSSIDYVKGSTTTLAFLAEGSAGYDQGLDSKRMANIVSLYSHLEDGSKAFGIQTRELYSDDVKIPIGFSTLIEEETAYRITMSDVLGANLTNATAYLIDVYEGTTTNLNETDYEFTSKDGRFDARFILQFKNENILSTSEEILEDIALFPNPTNGILNVIAPQKSISEINIYDVQGRKVMSKLVDSEDRTEVNISELTNAIYFINVTTNAGSITKRIIKN